VTAPAAGEVAALADTLDALATRVRDTIERGLSTTLLSFERDDMEELIRAALNETVQVCALEISRSRIGHELALISGEEAARQRDAALDTASRTSGKVAATAGFVLGVIFAASSVLIWRTWA
jgi:hypothetical protein